MKKSGPQIDREIREFLHARTPRSGNVVARVGFGTFSKSKLPTPPRFAATMKSEQYKPTRSERHDPKIPKGEVFACKDRHGNILGTSNTVQGAMAKAPPGSSYALVRGEWTSDGTHWGVGKGRQVAVREGGSRWVVG